MPVSTNRFQFAFLFRYHAENHKQRKLLKGLLTLACLALDISGHEMARRSESHIRNLLQSPLQVTSKRISDSGSNITAFVDELGPQLSSEASITLIGSDEFDELTVRWTAWEAPGFKASVQVYTEDDVSNTVNSTPSQDMNAFSLCSSSDQSFKQI